MKPPSPSRLLGAAAIAALGLVPAPVAAGLPSEWVGQWELDANGPRECAAKRIYAGGAQVHFLGYPDGTRILIVHNAGWPGSGGPNKLVSLRGRERLELKADEASPGGFLLRLGTDRVARVAASDAIEVVRADGSVVERIDLSGIAGVEARLPGCLARTAKHPWIVVPPPMVVPHTAVAPPPPAILERLGTPPRPKVELQALYSELDYPSAAIRAGEQGTVAFQLLVGTNGRVTDCLITASSGSESLDSATCRMLADRAVFEPARDRRGRAITGSLNGRIVWSMEQPEPPPPPR